MKKYILSFLTIFLTINSCYSQEEFSFELYFEDALGNKDTLVLGYDPLATDSIDVTFGEINIINQPWDSVFEVRAGDKSFNSNIGIPIYQSKKQIIDKTCNFDFDISINLFAINYPVTIHWDSTLFVNDSCRLASILSGVYQLETDVFGGPSAYLSARYGTIGTGNGTDSLIIDPNLWNGMLTSSYSIGITSISVMWLSFASPENFPSTKIEEFDMVDIVVYPNPATNSISFKNEVLDFKYATYEIFNSVGQLTQSGDFKSSQIDISNLPQGHYTTVLNLDEKRFKSALVICR